MCNKRLKVCIISVDAMAGFPCWEPLEKQFSVSTELHPASHQYLTAVNPANHLHNNSMDYVAVDMTRVTLQPVVGATDYVNASWVPGYNSDKQFIISQHPNNYSLEQFWHMVWQTDTQLIICLSAFQQPVSLEFLSWPMWNNKPDWLYIVNEDELCFALSNMLFFWMR